MSKDANPAKDTTGPECNYKDQPVIGASTMAGHPLDLLVRTAISCDQVAWLLDIFDRYLPQDSYPRVSQQRDMKKYGMLYEVMEIARLEFDGETARWNGTPSTARDCE